MLFPLRDLVTMSTMDLMSYLRFMTVLRGGKTYSAIKIMGKENSLCWVSPPSHSCGTLSSRLCGFRPTCAGMHHQCHSCAACHSRKGLMKGAPFLLTPPPPTPITSSVLSPPWQHGWPLFPLSAPRYNVTCHQGPFHLRWNPAAGWPVARA